jgi:RNA:NAD 2'-phosphotransferase (TPT1/KptA family)
MSRSLRFRCGLRTQGMRRRCCAHPTLLYLRNMSVGHSKKEIAQVLRHTTTHLEVTQTEAGHRWGYIRCTICGQVISIWST